MWQLRYTIEGQSETNHKKQLFVSRKIRKGIAQQSTGVTCKKKKQ